MKEIVDWLVKTESRAMELYGRAAELFKSEEPIHKYLLRLHNEEEMHLNLMREVEEDLKSDTILKPVLAISDAVMARVNSYFDGAENAINSNHLSKRELFRFMIDTEFSEWNNIFLYCVNVIKHKNNRHLSEIRKIQLHKNALREFLSRQPESMELVKKLRLLSDVYKEKFLIIDDEELFAESIQAVLADEVETDIAGNGAEGLEKLSKHYYGAILTDLNMPVLDGIGFFKKARELYPDIGQRVLFFTGNLREDQRQFFEENNLRYLIKPAGIGDIKDILLKMSKK